MKRCITTLAASLLLALGGGVANAYADITPTSSLPTPTSVQPATAAGQSQAPTQSNQASNEQLSGVAGAQNVQTGLNNNTVQASSLPTGGNGDSTAESVVTPLPNSGGNESNGNTNTAGDQTAVNGNNFQQSNESTNQSRSGGACCGKPDGRTDSNGASQQNSARSEQGSIVIGTQNVQTGLNNNTVQLGGHNESNHNTNTVGDQTAVNGNNFQQSNEQTSSKGDWKRGGDGNSGGQSNRAHNEQKSFVYGAQNVQTGLNNNTVQAGALGRRGPTPVSESVVPVTGGNESNGNTNTAGDQTAVNGNNFQQSNEQTSSSNGSWKGDWKDGTGRCDSKCEPERPCCDSKPHEHGSTPTAQSNRASNKQGAIVIGSQNIQTGLNNNTVQLGFGNESNHNTNTAGDQTAVNGNNFQQSNEQTNSRGSWKSSGGNSHGAGQSNSARNEQWSFVYRSQNIQTGLNNNTVQAGAVGGMGPVGRESVIPIGDGNESNGNTNTAGDQTAVNGNNFQQSNQQTGSSKGDWKDGNGRCESRCEPKGPCCGSNHDSRPAGPQSNRASNEQGAIVIGSQNIQTGLNNNTVQLGWGNESNGNTNTVGDQTAVNGNNFQQSNESTGSGGSQSNSAGGDWKGDKCGCDRKDGNEQGTIVIGSQNIQTGLNNNTVQIGGYNESNHNTNTAGDQTAVNGNNFQQSNESSGTSWKGGSSGGQSNRAGNEQLSFVWGTQNIQTGLNNNTVQLGYGNESNGNTNTAGDQTAVNGNNFQQSNESTGSNKGDWNGGNWDDGKDECHTRCEPKPCEPKYEPKPEPKPCEPKREPKPCEPKPKCEPRPCPDRKKSYGRKSYGKKSYGHHKSRSGAQSNRASNKQGAIVIGSQNIQTGLNNNTVQLGFGNESNHNTNTAGDQTAVNGNNFQQSNERG